MRLRSAAEHVGRADEVAREPIGERDFSPRWRGVVAADSPGLDEKDALVCISVAEERLLDLERALLSDAQETLALLVTQTIEQSGNAPHERFALDQHDSRCFLDLVRHRRLAGVTIYGRLPVHRVAPIRMARPGQQRLDVDV